MLDLSEDIVSVFCMDMCTHTKSNERKGERGRRDGGGIARGRETDRQRGKEGEHEQERDLTEKEILGQREF